MMQPLSLCGQYINNQTISYDLDVFKTHCVIVHNQLVFLLMCSHSLM